MLTLARNLAHDLDRALRGEFTKKEKLETGELGIAARRLLIGNLVLGMIYGICMGLYGTLRSENPSFAQLIATTFKVPLLFLLTLIVTYPSLYVFSALAGSSLRFVETLRLLLVAITINLIVLASFGPVTAFFTLSTTSYPFMVLLNVLFFGIAGIVGLVFLRRAMLPIFGASPGADDDAQKPADPIGPPAPPELRPPAPRPKLTPRDPATPIFRVWLVIFGVVGAQMGWILRPFIGDPNLPFELVREREANFFTAVIESIVRLFE